MTGEEIYNKYKGKTVLTNDPVRKGIVIGYCPSFSYRNCTIISVTGNEIGWHMDEVTDDLCMILNDDGDNPKGYWFITEVSFKKVYGSIIFGR